MDNNQDYLCDCDKILIFFFFNCFLSSVNEINYSMIAILIEKKKFFFCTLQKQLSMVTK